MARRPHARPDPLTTLMRARARHLLRTRTAAERNALRVMPLLWSARFRTPPFDVEAPGLVGGLRRTRWGRLCEQVGLRAPLGQCAARPLVAGLLLLPSGANLELIAMPVPDLQQADWQRFSRRLLAVGQWLAGRAPRLALSLGDAQAPLPDAFWSMGAVLAGGAPRPAESPETGAERALDRMVRAGDPLCQTLAFLTDPNTPAFSKLLAVAAGTGAAKHLASPSESLAAGAADPSPQRLLDLARREKPTLDELVAGARQVRAGALRSLRQLGRRYREQVRPSARALGLDSRWPTLLRDRLRAATDAVEVDERLEERGAVVSAEAVTLSTARSWVQARVEALPALGRARFGASWAPLAGFLDAPGTGDAVMVVLGGPKEMSLWVRRPARSRARARLLPESELLAQVARALARGAQLQVHALPSADRPLAARLAALAAAARSGWPSGLADGDRLLVIDRGRVRTLDALRWLSRPRRMRFFPQSAEELASLKPPRQSAISTVHAHVFEAGEAHAFVYYLDASGSLFRERCEKAALEAHLTEGQQLLREAGAVLSVTVSPALSALGGKRLWPDRPTAELKVWCRWPREVRMGTEQDGPMGWPAAAETVLSHWPVGVVGRVRVTKVKVSGPRVTPLTLLWLRSHALSRLERHVAAASRPRPARPLNPSRPRADELHGADNSFARHGGNKNAVHSFQHRLP